MKSLSLILASFIGAATLNASIIQGGTPLSGSTFQSYSLPNLTAQSSLGTSDNLGSFSVSSDVTLYYDPNGAANIGGMASCNTGKDQQGNYTSPTLSGLTNCIGDYNLSNANGSPVNQATRQASLYSSSNLTAPDPEITLTFPNSIFALSLVFAVPGGAGVSPTQVNVYNGNNLVESTVIAGGLVSSLEYLNITESTPFTSVVFTEFTSSGTPYDTAATSGLTWNAVLGNVEVSTAAATPEPGTLGLLGIGLASLGYFARRRMA
jgi:hypothetical protein